MEPTPPPEIVFSTYPFSEEERVEVRYHAGYPMYGGGPNGAFQTWRFFQVYGLMEFRLTNMTGEERARVRRMVAACKRAEALLSFGGEDLDTSKAGPWEHNPNEIADRDAFYRNQRRKLCDFLGVPCGPGVGSGAPSMSKVI